ncbi:metal dependent phosphohydrolase [Nitratidesulfovibrio vulgaris RCH1]|uniref:Metal dependent phosphohydrolase n=2 Tax=Nitratidesulfovibrio vulgaris TaxID=881 RepID=A0A0H3A8C0_NITV4|nr:metal dependent phosphohydrolase [Nitratidesulfovibrio vulgaris DP4]ADP87496.1 metal dependent phosphohydrolase [Nitratidesulfovibrio vulgaris RCH1]
MGKRLDVQLEVDRAQLLLCMSEAMELACPTLAGHQKRVAFIAGEIAAVLDLPEVLRRRLFVAALLHDVGALSPEEKMDLYASKVEECDTHCIRGARLLHQVDGFGEEGRVLRLHHATLRDGSLADVDEDTARLAQIVHLSDLVDRALDRGRYVLHQADTMCDMARDLARCDFEVSIVRAFLEVARREDFWLQMVLPTLGQHLEAISPCRGEMLDACGVEVHAGLVQGMVDFRSSFTAAHSAGVAEAADALGGYCDLSPERRVVLRIAGLLHDLGKMAVPTSILEKPSGLTKAEFAFMRQHTFHTYRLLRGVDGLGGMAAWAAYHHEKLDGSGYPFHLEGRALDPQARIIGVADIFTAMAEDRPYRKGQGREGVLRVLRDECTTGRVDGELVETVAESYPDMVGRVLDAQHAARSRFSDVLQPAGEKGAKADQST